VCVPARPARQAAFRVLTAHSVRCSSVPETLTTFASRTGRTALRSRPTIPGVRAEVDVPSAPAGPNARGTGRSTRCNVGHPSGRGRRGLSLQGRLRGGAMA